MSLYWDHGNQTVTVLLQNTTNTGDVHVVDSISSEATTLSSSSDQHLGAPGTGNYVVGIDNGFIKDSTSRELSVVLIGGANGELPILEATVHEYYPYDQAKLYVADITFVIDSDSGLSFDYTRGWNFEVEADASQLIEKTAFQWCQRDYSVCRYLVRWVMHLSKLVDYKVRFGFAVSTPKSGQEWGTFSIYSACRFEAYAMWIGVPKKPRYLDWDDLPDISSVLAAD